MEVPLLSARLIICVCDLISDSETYLMWLTRRRWGRGGGSVSSGDDDGDDRASGGCRGRGGEGDAGGGGVQVVVSVRVYLNWWSSGSLEWRMN